MDSSLIHCNTRAHPGTQTVCSVAPITIITITITIDFYSSFELIGNCREFGMLS